MDNKKEALILGLILLLAAGMRFWQLGEVPATINGDETGSLLHSWELMLGQITPFTLTHDFSVPALIFLPKVFLINILGLENTLVAVRLSTSLYSLLGLTVFYFLLRKDTSFFSAILATLLFASSYWYLNFSRLSWIAVDSVFLGLLFYYLLDKALIEEHPLYALLAGGAASLVWMNFWGGWIYLLAGLFIIVQKLITLRRILAPKVLLISLAFAITSIPMITTVSTETEKYLSRAQSRSIFTLETTYYEFQPQDIGGILRHQLAYTVRGFLLFDPEVSSEWMENTRLLPFEKPAVNLLVIVLFYIGMVSALWRRKGTFFFLVYLLNIAVLQLLAAYPPSWSRAIGVLPALYYFAGRGLEQVALLSKRVRLPVSRLVPGVLGVLVLIVAFLDVQVYWDWIQSEDFAQAQEPAIKVNELARWQQLQFEGLEGGKKAFSIYEWQAGWDLTITEVKDSDWLDWNDRNLAANGQWLVIIGDINNLTTEDIFLSTSEFVLRPLPLNGVFPLNEEATRAAGQQYGIENASAGIEGVNIEPGQTVPFLVAFDAPKALEEAALQATSTLWYKIGSVEEPPTLPADTPTTTRTP